MAKFMLEEECPFHEMTLFHASGFLNVVEAWTSSPCKFQIADVAMSLLIFDGVVDADELLLVLNEVLFGKIYQNEGTLFVDVSSDRLGIRRAILSPFTIFILHQSVGSMKTLSLGLEQLLQLLNQELKACLGGEPISNGL